MIVSGITNSGFKYNINDAACTDIRFVRATSDILRYNTSKQDANDTSRLMDAVDCLEKLLLPNDTERLYQHISGLNGGFVPVVALMNELNEMVLAATPKK